MWSVCFFEVCLIFYMICFTFDNFQEEHHKKWEKYTQAAIVDVINKF